MAKIIETLHPSPDLAPGPDIYPGMFLEEQELTPTDVDPVALDRHGVAVTYLDADTALVYVAPNNGRTVLHVRNDGASDCVLLTGIELTVDGADIPSRTVSIPAGEARFVGPFPTILYGHELSFAFDESDGISFAVLRPSRRLA